MRSIAWAVVLLAACACRSTAAQDAAVSIHFFRAKCPPVAVKGTLFIDGVKQAVVPVRRYAVVRVAPGKHELKFAFPLWAGTPSKKLTLEARPGAARYFYYTTDMGFSIAAPVPTSTITPQLVEISEAGAKRLMYDFGRIPSPE
jgi:hypothetical protein